MWVRLYRAWLYCPRTQLLALQPRWSMSESMQQIVLLLFALQMGRCVLLHKLQRDRTTSMTTPRLVLRRLCMHRTVLWMLPSLVIMAGEAPGDLAAGVQ